VAKVAVSIESYPIPTYEGSSVKPVIDTSTMQFGVGGLQEYWVNKVWDPGGPPFWIDWETTPDADPGGLYYPDPYGSGFGATEGYRIAGRRYR
jgi:hypothetical protein